MRKQIIPALIMGVVGLCGAEDPPVSEALKTARNDVQEAMKEVATIRQQIAAERGPLVKSIDEGVQAVRALRQEVDEADRLLQTATSAQEAQLAALGDLESEWSQVEALLEEADRSVPTRLALVEAEVWAGIRAGDKGGSVLEAMQHLEQQRWGGHRFDASVINAAGEGALLTVTQWGPLGWVNQGENWIPLYTRLNQPVPTMDETGMSPAGGLPIDATGGMAAGIQADIVKTWVERIQEGGAVMVPLLAVGLISLVLVLWKAATLARVRPVPDATVEAFVAALSNGDAGQQVARLSEPSRSLFQHVVDHARAPREQLEELLHERILALLPTLDRHLGTLAVLAGIAPLLGLLGTVTGMIKTFQLITVFGSGDARMLSGGIAEALMTTAVGLIIAVPVLVAHAFLARRVRVLVADLENTVGRLISRMGSGEDANG